MSETHEQNIQHQRSVALLQKALNDWPSDTITVGDLNSALGERAFGVMMLLFALPNCIPAPPGLSSIFGLPLFFCAVQLVRGQGVPWQPNFVAARSFKRETLMTGIKKVEPHLAKIEKYCRPRLPFLVEGLAERILALLVCVFSLCIIIPLFGTHMIPAFGSALIALSIIERDGVLALIGSLVGLLGTVITIGIVGGFIAGLKFAF